MHHQIFQFKVLLLKFPSRCYIKSLCEVIHWKTSWNHIMSKSFPIIPCATILFLSFLLRVVSYDHASKLTCYPFWKYVRHIVLILQWSKLLRNGHSNLFSPSCHDIHAMLCHAMPWHAMASHVMPCHAMTSMPVVSFARSVI